MDKHYQVAVVGGAGHVGAPLSIVLASKGIPTLVNDLNKNSLALLASGKMPFLEDGAEPLLAKALQENMLGFSSDPESIANASIVVVTIGTPIDEFHNPRLSALTQCIDGLLPFINDDQLIILRSTVAPGVTDYLDRYLRNKGKKSPLAFCPERVVQGKGVEEIQTLPQLVSGTSDLAVKLACELFAKIAPDVIVMSTTEAEFAKLISNAYRYIQFAATNQLYMLVESAGLDYNKLLTKMKQGYPRMGSIPSAGFAAGPCLMKDTMQLFSFEKKNFFLGQVAMTINEGLPDFMISQLISKTNTIIKMKIGILGMAFKAECDDIRDSLSYRLKKTLEFKGALVSCSDEYVTGSDFISKEELVKDCDIIIVGVPHKAYIDLVIPKGKEVIDLWNIL